MKLEKKRMAEKKRHSHNDGWQLHAAAGKKRMAEKKEKKGAKLTDEGNRTQVSKIKRDHLTITLRLLS